jgi:hypothetical protein
MRLPTICLVGSMTAVFLFACVKSGVNQNPIELARSTTMAGWEKGPFVRVKLVGVLPSDPSILNLRVVSRSGAVSYLDPLGRPVTSEDLQTLIANDVNLAFAIDIPGAFVPKGDIIVAILRTFSGASRDVTIYFHLGVE